MKMHLTVLINFGGLPHRAMMHIVGLIVKWMTLLLRLNSAIVLSYKVICMPTVREHISCERKMANTVDPYALCFWYALAFSPLGTSGLMHSFTCSVFFKRAPHSYTGPSCHMYLSHRDSNRTETLATTRSHAHCIAICKVHKL